VKRLVPLEVVLSPAEAKQQVLLEVVLSPAEAAAA
jgi:hypothetical protein